MVAGKAQKKEVPLPVGNLPVKIEMDEFQHQLSSVAHIRFVKHMLEIRFGGRDGDLQP